MIEICRMTATFGKLEHETISFHAGLNVIEAPNEWGKSTWCAFLAAMLYGLDTRQRTAKGALAAKERYKPWSGKSMEGTVELLRDGRPVTIQRQTKGRVPMGVFRAFDTESGLDLPELTAENCGLRLLGVEESVFRRSGFIRLADLPVTKDEATMRRLNAMVSTGEQGAEAEILANRLRDLKNKCQYNKSGALPQAKIALEEARQALQEQQRLLSEQETLTQSLQENEKALSLLQRHRKALQARSDQNKLAQLQEVQKAAADAKRIAADAQENCKGLPARDEAVRQLQVLRQLQEALHSMELEQGMGEQQPASLTLPTAIFNLSPAEMEEKAASDLKALGMPPKAQKLWLWWSLGLLLLLGAGVLLWQKMPWSALIGAGLGGIFFLVGLLLQHKSKRKLASWQEKKETLLEHYGAARLTEISEIAKRAAAEKKAYLSQYATWEANAAAFRTRKSEILERISKLTGGEAPSNYGKALEQALSLWEQAANAQRDLARAENHFQAMQAVAGNLQETEGIQTELHLTWEETESRLALCEARQRTLRSRQDEIRGNLSGKASAPVLEARIAALESRIAALTDYYRAAAYGLAALEKAQEELRRRFAPQITARAKEILQKLTLGRYDKLLLEQDMTLSAGTAEEDSLRSALWRSEGATDQLYLALRLAMSEVLLPEGAPLILDDALVRFDNARLCQAMDVLQDEAQKRQILLFTCTGRERILC